MAIEYTLVRLIQDWRNGLNRNHQLQEPRMQGRIVNTAGGRNERECGLDAAFEEAVEDTVAGDEVVIEISDRDYRSICWPCCALEEEGDGKPTS